MERGVSVCVPSAPYSSSTPNRSNPSATLYTHPVQYALGHPAPPPAQEGRRNESTHGAVRVFEVSHAPATTRTVCGQIEAGLGGNIDERIGNVRSGMR